MKRIAVSSVRQLYRCTTGRSYHSNVNFKDVEILENGETALDAVKNILARERAKDVDFDKAFHVTDLGDIYLKLKTWRQLLPRVEPFYAVKCNDDMNILSTFARLRTGFDCASKDELLKCLQMGVPLSQIAYAHPIKQTSYLKYAAKHNIDLVTFDCEEELVKIKDIFPGSRLVLRIRPPAAFYTASECSQFGCHIFEVQSLLQTAKKLNLNVIGVSFHSGSGFLDGQVYEEQLRMSQTVFQKATSEGFQMTLLDIGGGFWGNKPSPVQFSKIANQVNRALDRLFPVEKDIRIIAEPGRHFVSSAVTLAFPVIGKKVLPKCEESEYPNKGCSRMYFVNDGRYGSFHDISYTTAHVWTPKVLESGASSGELHPSSVWGPSLSAGDCVFRECLLPDMSVGEWLYVENMGAYTFTLHRGDTKFNGMEKPKEFYVCARHLWNEINGK